MANGYIPGRVDYRSTESGMLTRAPSGGMSPHPHHHHHHHRQHSSSFTHHPWGVHGAAASPHGPGHAGAINQIHKSLSSCSSSDDRYYHIPPMARNHSHESSSEGTARLQSPKQDYSSVKTLPHSSPGSAFDSPRQIAASVLLLASQDNANRYHHNPIHHHHRVSSGAGGCDGAGGGSGDVNNNNSNNKREEDGDDREMQRSRPLKKRKTFTTTLSYSHPHPCHVSPISLQTSNTADDRTQQQSVATTQEPASSYDEDMKEDDTLRRPSHDAEDDDDEDDDEEEECTTSKTTLDKQSIHRATPPNASNNSKTLSTPSPRPPTQEVVIPHFPSVLHMLLSSSIASSADHGKVIQWVPHGKAWRIVRWEALRRQILPQFFPQLRDDNEDSPSVRRGDGNNTDSVAAGSIDAFLKHLSAWGFEEVTDGPDVGAYAHPVRSWTFLVFLCLTNTPFLFFYL